MQTPAGTECRHYYEDYNRGREIQQCRLNRLNPASLPWKPGDCAHCPVPDILRANGNPDMVLTLTIRHGLLGLGRKLQVRAFCERHMIDIDEPPVGCPQCNAERPGFAAFFGENDDPRHPI